jgi:hypothetical protein
LVVINTIVFLAACLCGSIALSLASKPQAIQLENIPTQLTRSGSKEAGGREQGERRKLRLRPSQSALEGRCSLYETLRERTHAPLRAEGKGLLPPLRDPFPSASSVTLKKKQDSSEV